MKGSKTALTLAEKCKSILVSNWQGNLNTIKADSRGSKQDIYTSKVKYMLKKGRPYVWILEKDLHNVNTIIDERASLAIASPFPGPLAGLFKSIKKIPVRIALTGDLIPLNDEKARYAAESLNEGIQAEQRAISKSTYTVSAILSSCKLNALRSESLQKLLDEDQRYCIYRFNPSSCLFLDGHGRSHEVDTENMGTSKPDPLAYFSAKLIDGVNRSETRRRALILFCLVYFNANARDAYMLSVDCKGFCVLGKVPSKNTIDGEFHWKEFRFDFKEETCDIEMFCSNLVEMEKEAVKKVSSYSGLG